MDLMSIAIIVVVSVSGFYFHWWLYARIKRWVNRDLALSMAGSDGAKREYMLEQLAEAQQQKIGKKQLADWLKQRADGYETRNCAS